MRGQVRQGESLDTFRPSGPVIVTTDEISDPLALRLRLWGNERLQQDGAPADMTFAVAQIIAHVSRVTTLEPCDLITTGTSKGVGCIRQPPICLVPGDIARCSVDEIGEFAEARNRLANSRPGARDERALPI